MTPEEEVVALWAENARLREELARLRERLEVVEKKKTPAPEFVRPNQVAPERMRQDSERKLAWARISPSFPGFDRGYAACSSAHTSPQRS